MFPRSGFCLLLFSLAVLPSAAQIGSGSATASLSDNSATGFPLGEGSQQSQPYTLVQQTTTLRTLADGTHITTVREETRVRDADGRTRTEIIRDGVNPVPFNLVQIFDPVAHTWTSLDARNKIAHVNHMPAPAPPSPEQQALIVAARAKAQALRASQAQTDGAPAAQGSLKSQRSVETLAPRTIAGVAVEGRRITRTIPAGKEGNDRDLTITTETWTSPELRIALERTTDDPRTGKITTTTTSLERVSPDPALFQIPADYKVIDQHPTPME